MDISFKRAIQLVAAAIILAAVSVARAETASCDGPVPCCPPQVRTTLDLPVTVQIGAALVGLHRVTEREGTWDADYYLYEAWPPTPGFVPQTEVSNEVNRTSEQFTTVELDTNRCVRWRRIRSVLYSAFNLKLFPFDQQRLTLTVSDARFDNRSVRYAPVPYLSGIDRPVLEQLFDWTPTGTFAFETTSRQLGWESGSPAYDYATFTVAVRRHVSFHLMRFFFPLLIIVLVAVTPFWMDPEDLSSQVGVGVTCLLAVIAFQYAEASTLPDVEYLTLADRIYFTCYLFIAASIVQSVVTNGLNRAGKRDQALKLDRTCRWAVPILLVLAVGVSIWRSLGPHA